LSNRAEQKSLDTCISFSPFGEGVGQKRGRDNCFTSWLCCLQM